MPASNNHARGSILADFKTDGKLLPAEEELHASCVRGKTCKIGDGKIFITNLEQIIRIRTDERGDEAV